MNNILFLEAVDSTNRIARELALSGKPQGYAVLADCQTAGRGRLGKVWQSPPDTGLYGTIILRPELRIEDYSKITIMTGLAVCRVLEKICRLEPQLKWPNDIYIADRKCGGILVETSSLQGDPGEQNFALVGIGLNVNTEKKDFDDPLQKTATSILIESGREQSILTLFTAIRNQLLHLVSQLETEGFSNILDQWRQRDFLHGKWMNWVTPAGKIIYGKSQGVDNNGILMVRDHTGKNHEVLSGDVTLATKEKGDQ